MELLPYSFVIMIPLENRHSVLLIMFLKCNKACRIVPLGAIDQAILIYVRITARLKIVNFFFKKLKILAHFPFHLHKN